jgi:hypothetical protein
MEKNSIPTIAMVIVLSVALLGGTVISSARVAYSQREGKIGERGICGPMDVTIALDDTSSMSGAINNIKAELPSIINQAQVASGGDLRLGFITFKDIVNVRNPLTTGISAVQSSIAATTASGGNGLPEASDEAKNTAINNLGPRSGQIGDFSSAVWRPDPVVKILILITDAPPAGFNDVKDPIDVTRMHNVALTALNRNILVSDVFVPTTGDYAGQLAILKDDADTSRGAFTTTGSDGTGTGTAIKDIINRCGKGTPAVCPENNVQHWDKIVFMIISPDLGRKVNLTAKTELDIKVLDDPLKVADIKQKVLDFLKVPNAPRDTIRILDVNYAIICASSAPSVPTTPSTPTPGTLALAKIKELQSTSKNAINISSAQNTTAK